MNTFDFVYTYRMKLTARYERLLLTMTELPIVCHCSPQQMKPNFLVLLVLSVFRSCRCKVGAAVLRFPVQPCRV